jgi:hypothetical protein
MGAMTVMTTAGEDFEGSAIEFAIRLTAAEEGICEGAVYVMAAPEALVEADSVPQALAVQLGPERAQETPLFWLSLATVAVNCPVCASNSEEVAGVTLTEMACGGGSATVGGSLCG